MTAGEASRALGRLRRAARAWRSPSLDGIAGDAALATPFGILVSTILSLRTKDAVTDAASRRLLPVAPTPSRMVTLTAARIERLIYPVGFYRTKARTLRAIARALLRHHGGSVPAEMDALLALPGVGRKTANLVLVLGFGVPAVCVDTHVHRIANRWGLVRTRTPDETEVALRRVVSPRHWMHINATLVAFGQNVCTPVSPRCSSCPIASRCDRHGVGRAR